MIRTKSIEDQLRRGRLDAKTLDSMFRRRIEEGANCSHSSPRRFWPLSRRSFPPLDPRRLITSLGLGAGPTLLS